MNWSALANVVGSALAAGLAAFVTAKQTNASDETAGATAGIAILTAVIQHFRGKPEVVAS